MKENWNEDYVVAFWVSYFLLPSGTCVPLANTWLVRGDVEDLNYYSLKTRMYLVIFYICLCFPISVFFPFHPLLIFSQVFYICATELAILASQNL